MLPFFLAFIVTLSTDTKEEAELVAIQNELDILSVNKKDLLETQERLDRRLHKSGKLSCFTIYHVSDVK